MAKTASITVVVPALNEAKNIRSTLRGIFRACHRMKIASEVIAVDDGSRDRTPQILQQLQRVYPHLQVVRHEHPSGIGGAFLAGVARAHGEAVVMIPGDNENRVEDILAFLDLMQRVDIIVPFVHNSELRNLRRRFISSLYRFIISFSFGTNLNYYNGTVIYRTRLLQALKICSTGFFYQAETLIRALRRGARFAEVPVLLQNRRHGRSKAVTLKSLRAVMLDFMCLFWDIHFRRVEQRAPKFA
ncbi:MAG: glycosyltransferase family 2 protein [Verrucomicrobia bacterium]|nr:glycosyltransferase family 2 protein [Verrucomicrobiota bacterium]